MSANDNDWYTEWERMTASDSEWQQVVQRVTASGTICDNDWQQLTTSDKELKRTTRSHSKWYWVVISAKPPFLRIREYPISKHLKGYPLNLKPWGEPSKGPIELINRGYWDISFKFLTHTT